MNQTTTLQNGSPLLNYAISRLNPEVFSHPIWMHYGKKKIPVSLSIIDDLLFEAKNLQEHDPSGACQVLLICTVYQNYAGQHVNALRTIYQALDLAKRASLADETIWAIWGACALCFQQGNYQQAANSLMDLQAILSKQNEWMLVSFIDVFKEYLFQPEANAQIHSKFEGHRPFKDLIAPTVGWLQQWGYSVFTSESENGHIHEQKPKQGNWLSRLLQPNLTFKRWRVRWNTFILAFRGELKLQLYQSGGDTATQIFNEDSHHTNSSPPTNPTKSSSTSIPLPADKPLLDVQKVDVNPSSEKENTTTSVIVQMLGTFSIIIQDLTPNLHPSRGSSLLKYLLLHYKQKLPREVLMEVFWPESDFETARNNLNVAIYSLRRALRKVTNIPLVVYENGTYGPASNLQIWLDVEEFEHCVKEGKQLEAQNRVASAVTEYEIAVNLYRGDFLEDHLYESWTVLERERLRIAYLDTLDHLSQIYFNQKRYGPCVTLCQLILNRDLCREDAHCRLMRCYSRLGQGPLALRQYQICAETLLSELEVEPAPETTRLYEKIRHHKLV